MLADAVRRSAHSFFGGTTMKRLLVALVLVVMSSFAFAAVNINTATKEELDALPGIGPVKAQAIVDYRNANGPFKTPADVMKVKGIKEGEFGKIKDQISVSGSTAPVAAPAKAAEAPKAPAKATEAPKASAAAPAEPAKDESKAKMSKADEEKAAKAKAGDDKAKRAADEKAAKEKAKADKAEKAKAAKEEKAKKAADEKAEKEKSKADKDAKAAKDKGTKD